MFRAVSGRKRKIRDKQKAPVMHKNQKIQVQPAA
jgi:hypothetical protein